MSYKCKICGSNDVDNQGDICELCAIGQDPYAASMTNSGVSSQSNISASDESTNDTEDTAHTHRHGSSRRILINTGSDSDDSDTGNTDVADNQNPPKVQVYSAGQVPQQTTGNTTASPVAPAAAAKAPLTEGISKNISIDNDKRSFLVKWIRALFTGIPFTIDDEVTMFQVFPDYSGTALNSQGNACDQVIVYGKLNHGAISENNDVEVYGRRDSNNNIVAKTIRNKASGTIVSPKRTLSATAVWIITAVLLCLVFGVVGTLGTEGFIWTVVIILCFTNLPLVTKVMGVVFGMLFSLFKKFL